MTTKKGVKLILDVNLLVGALYSITKDGEEKNEFEEGFNKVGLLKELFEEKYGVHTKIIVRERDLERAYEILKGSKEYSSKLSQEKIKVLEKYLSKRKFSGDENGYSISINGINIYVVRSNKEDRYVEELYKKHPEYVKIVEGLKKNRYIDGGDVDLMKFVIAFSAKHNGKNYYILLTLDERILKERTNICRVLNKENKIFISTPENLLYSLKIDKGDYKNLEESLRLNSIIYFFNSENKNKKNK